MSLDDKHITNLLEEKYGKFETYLEMLYLNNLKKVLNKNNNTSERSFWMACNQVIIEFKNLDNKNASKTIMYCITNEPILTNEIMNIINSNKKDNIELERLFNKLYRII